MRANKIVELKNKFGEFDVYDLLFIAFCFVDDHFHEKEKEFLLEKTNISEETIKKVSNILNINKSKIREAAEELFEFSLQELDLSLREEATVQLFDLANSDGHLDDAEKYFLELLEEKWGVKVEFVPAATNDIYQVLNKNEKLDLEEGPQTKRREITLSEEATEEQKDIITQPCSSWQLVNALPGTGKTWTAYRRLAYLISEENIEPSTIWVMSFTKTAVRELSNRLEDLTHFNGSDGFSFSPIAGLKVSTIDSHAGKIRYGFSKEEAKTIFGEGGFDTNISEATNTILSDDEISEGFFSRINHLLLDEAQDITGDRAIFISALMSRLKDSCGVTVLYDPAQSLYDIDWDAPKGEDTTLLSLEDKILEEDLLNKFTTKRLTINQRIEDSGLLRFIENNHNMVAYRSECSNEEFENVKQNISEVAHQNFANFDPSEILKLENEYKNSLVLFREKREVLKASEDSDFFHRVRMGGMPSPVHPWLGILFWDFEGDSIDKEEFFNLWKSKSDNKILQELNASDSWEFLLKRAPLKKKFVDLYELRKILSNRSIDPEFINPDLGLWGPIFGTVHGSKGREANSVAYFNDLGVPKDKTKRQESMKVLYVAASRPKNKLSLGPSFNMGPPGKTLKKTGRRFIRPKKEKNWIFMQVGIQNDYDQASLVNKNMYPEDFALAMQKNLLDGVCKINNPANLSLYRLPKEKNFNYELRFDLQAKDFGWEKTPNLGQMNRNQFNGDLLDILKKENINNKSIVSLNNLKLIGLASGVLPPNDDRLSFIHKPFSRSGFWLYPVFLGSAYLNFGKNYGRFRN